MGVLTAAFAFAIAVNGLAQQVPLTGSSAFTYNTGHKNPLTEDFATLANQSLDKWNVPGLSIAVIDGDDVYAEGYGFAAFPDKKATPETLWYAGSTTKAQVDAALGLLIDSGQYPELSDGWSTPISSIIRDDFVLQDQWATSHITLEDAASHRSGLGGQDSAWAGEIDGTPATIKDVVRNLRNLPLSTEPRVKFEYCNAMYVVLSHVIESITGEWLGNTLQRLIWEPLGMKSTYFSMQDVLNAPEQLATGYYWDKADKVFKEIPNLPLEQVSGAGAVISNVLDYTKWIKCQLTKSAPLPERVHDQLRKPRMYDQSNLQPGSGSSVTTYSLGWWRAVHQGHVIYMHSGSTDAFKTEVFWLPEDNYGIVAMANTGSTSAAAAMELIWKLIYDKFEVPSEKRVDYAAVIGKQFDEADKLPERAMEIVYPDRPKTPLAPTLGSEKLTGRYRDDGYGTIDLREVTHPDRPGVKMLVADRYDLLWSHQVRLEHVSGDHWLYTARMLSVPTQMSDLQPAEFTFGVDGRVSGLRVERNEYGEEVVRKAATFFKKVD